MELITEGDFRRALVNTTMRDDVSVKAADIAEQTSSYKQAYRIVPRLKKTWLGALKEQGFLLETYTMFDKVYSFDGLKIFVKEMPFLDEEESTRLMLTVQYAGLDLAGVNPELLEPLKKKYNVDITAPKDLAAWCEEHVYFEKLGDIRLQPKPSYTRLKSLDSQLVFSKKIREKEDLEAGIASVLLAGLEAKERNLGYPVLVNSTHTD